MRDSWRAKINRKLLPKELFICSDHFEPECFKRDLKVRFDFSKKNYFDFILRVSYLESNIEENWRKMVFQLYLIILHYPKSVECLFERLQNQTNRQIIEDALFQAPEEIKENPSNVSTTITDNLGIRQVDKAIDNTPKMKSTRTQYCISHFKEESLIPPKVSTPLLVKAPQRSQSSTATKT